MNGTNEILRTFLHNAGALDSIKLGGGKKNTVFTDEDRQSLLRQLLARRGTADALALVIALLHVVIFLLGVWAVYYYRATPLIATGVVGGAILSLLVILRGLRGFWLEKWAADIILALLPTLPADEATRLVKAVYFAGVGSGSSRPLQAPARSSNPK